MELTKILTLFVLHETFAFSSLYHKKSLLKTLAIASFVLKLCETAPMQTMVMTKGKKLMTLIKYLILKLFIKNSLANIWLKYACFCK